MIECERLRAHWEKRQVYLNTKVNQLLSTSPTIGIFTTLDPSAHGGLETYIRTLTVGLANRNVKVLVNGASVGEQICISQEWGERQRNLLSLMTRRHLWRIAPLVAATQGRQWAAEAIRDCNLVHYVGNGWNLLGFSLSAEARKRCVPMTCLPAVHPGTWGDSDLDINLFKKIDKTFALSDYEEQFLRKRGVPQHKLTRCGCCTSIASIGSGERFRSKHRVGNRFTVLFIGRKSRNKGYHALREAVAKLNKDGSDCVLISIGRDIDPPYPELPPIIDVDLGVVDDSVKADALAACDVFALPSSEESFGIVYLEAWANGKAVICGSAPASQELIAKHNGGIACDGTSEGIENALKLLHGDRVLSRTLAVSGRLAVEEEYSQEHVVNTHLECWRSLLG